MLYSCDSVYVGVADPSFVAGMNGAAGLSVYPNPFRDVTIVKYYLPFQTFADLSVYDMMGRKIRSLRRADHSSGMHELLFERDDLKAGLYYVVLTTPDNRAALKIIIE